MEESTITQEIVDETATLSFKEFCEKCVTEDQYIIEMVEVGILQPLGSTGKGWQFTLRQVQRFWRAERLRQDLNLNLAGVALTLELLDELIQARQQLQLLHYQLHLLQVE